MSATETMTTLPPAKNASKAIPGLYIGELLNIRNAGASQFPDEKTGEYRDQVSYSWKIVKVIDSEADDPQSMVGETLTRYATLSMGTRSNMRLWAEAHLGRQLNEDEVLDIATIVGTFAKIHVAQKQGQRGLETHVTLTHVEPPKGKAKAAPAPPTTATDDDEDPWGNE